MGWYLTLIWVHVSLGADLTPRPPSLVGKGENCSQTDMHPPNIHGIAFPRCPCYNGLRQSYSVPPDKAPGTP
jgi:hypothetical protein